MMRSSSAPAQDCPACGGMGAFDTWSKPCREGSMHKKANCPVCEGECTVRSQWNKCHQCKGLGGFDTWSKPARATQMHFKQECRTCIGKGWLQQPKANSPSRTEHRDAPTGAEDVPVPKVGRTIRYQQNSAFALNLHGGVPQNGAVLNLWERNGHASQRWIIRRAHTANTFKIHYAADPQFVVNLHCDKHENGAEVNLWACNTSPSQEWLLEGNMIRCAASPGFVLNLHSGLEENGGTVNLSLIHISEPTRPY
eukprot:TRINITY_DN14053_c0_g1_i3.p1 TRINITY_DN14053_c0_g1~~TRINITY_DN14053_c0_g1_i3.p1  ORF type:complete len:253 (-),score=28.78 TRINITY_DN14053_c0_g1_i3:57-815(-)